MAMGVAGGAPGTTQMRGPFEKKRSPEKTHGRSQNLGFCQQTTSCIYIHICGSHCLWKYGAFSAGGDAVLLSSLAWSPPASPLGRVMCVYIRSAIPGGLYIIWAAGPRLLSSECAVSLGPFKFCWGEWLYVADVSDRLP